MPAAPRMFPGVPDDVFVFASIAEWSDRKNPDGLVKAFCRAFAGRRDVALLLKLGSRVAVGQLREAMIRIRALTSRLRRVQPPPVFVVTEDLGAEAVAHLYARADAYVSLHRAEGFGLCLAEAMSAEVPVVATGYSGNLEFMDDSTAWLVRHRMVRVEQTLSPTWLSSRMHWAEPDLDDAADVMRAVVANPGRARAMAKAARLRVERDLDPRRIGETMRASLPSE